MTKLFSAMAIALITLSGLASHAGKYVVYDTNNKNLLSCQGAVVPALEANCEKLVANSKIIRVSERMNGNGADLMIWTDDGPLIRVPSGLLKSTDINNFKQLALSNTSLFKCLKAIELSDEEKQKRLAAQVVMPEPVEDIVCGQIDLNDQKLCTRHIA